MMAEFAKTRIAKIRNDYSKQDLKNKLGFNNKENRSATDFISWIQVR